MTHENGMIATLDAGMARYWLRVVPVRGDRTTRCCLRRWRYSSHGCIRVTQPLLQEFFVGAYILLAPFAGPFADALPKGRAISNATKLVGLAGDSRAESLAYGMVGIGAATVSPAKYGILSELTLLITGEGQWPDGVFSTIAAILIGAVAGGTLADHRARRTAAAGGDALAAAANLLDLKLFPHTLCRAIRSADLRDFKSCASSFGSRRALSPSSAPALFWARARPCDSRSLPGSPWRSASRTIACQPILTPWSRRASSPGRGLRPDSSPWPRRSAG